MKFEELMEKLKACEVKLDSSLEAFLYIIYKIGYEEGQKNEEPRIEGN